jgi:hypothetical protein
LTKPEEAVEFVKQTGCDSLAAATAGTYSVAMVPSTPIYLDKSKAGLPNSQGALADCKVGDSIEVKFVDNARSKSAEWIKVQKAP